MTRINAQTYFKYQNDIEILWDYFAIKDMSHKYFPWVFLTNSEFETLLFLANCTKFQLLEVNSNSNLSPDELTEFNETRRQIFICAILDINAKEHFVLGRFELR